MKNITINLFFILFPIFLFSQEKSILKGTVKDIKTNEALVGVSISVNEQNATTTDVEGNYSISLEAGDYKIMVRYIGYENIQQKISLLNADVKELNFELKQNAKLLEIVTVSGSRYERNLSDETVSIEVLKTGLLQNSNVITLNEGMDKITGVVIVDNQITIRGGSGYSFGVGSRVQLMIDDMPMLTVDRSEIRWNIIPMELMDQVEVLKSASSALYGASALNGVVSVKTGYAKDKPETEALIYSQFYDTPRRDSTKWWAVDSTKWWGKNRNKLIYPIRYGGQFSHKQRFGQHDVSIGANFNKTVGFIRLLDFGHRRLTLKYRYRAKNVDGLSMGLSANLMESEEVDYFFWNGYSTQVYIPFGSDDAGDKGTNTNLKRRTVILDPWISYFSKSGTKHTFRNRFYYTNLLVATNPIRARQLFSEYQIQHTFNFGLGITAGVVGQFAKLDDPSEFGIRRNDTYSGYMQIDYKIKQFNFILGGRIEHYKLDSITTTQPVLNAGINYQAGRASWLRANFAQGFRFPSLAERFADEALTSQVKILPSPDLKPEYGFNTELGFKQGIKINNWLGYADVSLFWMEYWDMIEFLFGFYAPEIIPPGKNTSDYLGFKAQNISRARIAGYEISLLGSGKIGKIPVRVQSGYTYNYGADLNQDTTLRNAAKFTKYFFNSIGTKLTDLKTTNDSVVASAMLKYRFRHTVKFDVELDLWNFTWGTEVRYYSFVEKVDDVFELFIPELGTYRKENNKGAVVFNQRISYDFKKFGKLSFIVNNVGNREISIRPARMEAPRNFTLQYRISIGKS